MPHLRKRAAAKQDLIEHFVYLAENAGVETADRFLACVNDSLKTLEAHPDIGPQLALRNPALQSLRKWRVKDFENVLIFYESELDGVTIVRVLHASRDWWTLLGLW
jgi:toxin ParE1/3/4